MGALAPELRLAAGGGNQAATNLIEKKILELPGLGRDIDVLLGHYYTTATRALDGIRIGITPDELAQRHAAWEATYIRGIIVAALADQFSQSQLPTSALDAADAFDRTHLRYGEVHRRPS